MKSSPAPVRVGNIRAPLEIENNGLQPTTVKHILAPLEIEKDGL